MPSNTAALALGGQIGDNRLRAALETAYRAAASVTELDKPSHPPLPGGSLDLEKLIRNGQAGDESSIEALYAGFKDRVFGLAYRHTGNAVIAEDLLQDIFIQVFRHLGDVDRPEFFPAWLYRISINACYSYLRKKRREAGSFVPLSSIEWTTAESSVEAPRSELREPLDQAIRTLPERLRSVFILHDVEGFRHEEIARILGCSAGTSKSQLFKARMKIRGFLGKKGISEGGER
jgi:RNA polymerase sigma-70 factor (ECF subfamily)